MTPPHQRAGPRQRPDQTVSRPTLCVQLSPPLWGNQNLEQSRLAVPFMAARASRREFAPGANAQRLAAEEFFDVGDIRKRSETGSPAVA